MIKRMIIMCLLFCSVGCGTATMRVIKMNSEGRIISINEVKYNALFNRRMEGVKVNLKTGSVEIGSSGGDSGALSNIAKISAGAIGMKLVAP